MGYTYKCLLKNLKILPVLAASLLIYCRAYAEIKVTGLEKNGTEYAVSLNDSIKISGIKLKKTNSGNEIEFPQYVSKGVVYKQMSVLNRDYKNYLIGIIEKGIISNTENGKISYKINKFKPLKNHNSVKAFMSVIFDGCLEVECRVMNGKNGMWIAWPAVKKESGWVKNFEFADLKLKKEIESALIGYYNGRNGK
ncbi:MAG: SpoVG family protein [Endomicrobia bacterium]|nr:SpoVG family protein [Endomicrobiia bacterium]MCL2799594.1 SpoVG family protein [Endomicrobiia bacterium]